MIQDPLTLYKLIVLYMLNRVTFPMTTAQVSDFILGRDYTNFLTLQQVINELTDARLISPETIRNRTHLSITAEGRETLNFFQNRISEAIKQDIDAYFRENEYSLRNEVSVLGDYYKSTSGEYEAHLTAKDRGIRLVDITLSVPDENTAAAICDNWQKKSANLSASGTGAVLKAGREKTRSSPRLWFILPIYGPACSWDTPASSFSFLICSLIFTSYPFPVGL